MKKLLSLVALLSLATISVTQVTSCGCTSNNPSVKTQQPTIYIDGNGEKHTTNERDLSKFDATEILQIGFYKNKNDNSIRAVRMPNNVEIVPATLPKEITSLTAMFRGATMFNQNLSGWDVSNVTSMSSMFDGATAFNGDISGWNTANVTRMSYMFARATMFNQNLSGWDVSNVTSMSSMFDGATAFNGDISGWNTANVTDMASMFRGATMFNQNLSGWDVSNVINHGNFSWQSGLSPENLPHWLS